MYLAEDRILCFEIVTKKREAWTWVLSMSWLVSPFDLWCSLKYVKSAKASTDVPTTVSTLVFNVIWGSTFSKVPEFISQRRRWLNGSLFASIHATVFWFRIWTSGQNIFRMILLQASHLNCGLFCPLLTFYTVDWIYLQCYAAFIHMDLFG